MRNYERLSIYDFGDYLLTTSDLDPVYIILTESPELDEEQLARWLIAYWCLYSVGPASLLSEYEGPNFWDKLGEAACNEQPTPLATRWPRGHERRHFRGAAAVKAVRGLRSLYEQRPERLVEEIVARSPDQGNVLQFKTVADRVQKLPLFGPWISFKVADMAERVLGVPVCFDEAAIFMFKDPAKAATRLWREHNPKLALAVDEGRARVKQEMINHGVSQHLIHHFSTHLAPPGRDRPLGLQEVETILCKWKSHMNGHYPLGNDTREIATGLRAWKPASETAGVLLKSAENLEKHL